MKRKGELGWPVRILVMALMALVVSLIFLAFFIPTAEAAGEAAGCDGVMRAIASALSSAADLQIC